MILMESYYYYLLSISFGYVFCLHMLCIKVYKKTSVGETHCDNKTEFNHENYEIYKAMSQGPHPTKRPQAAPGAGRSASSLGRLDHHGAASPQALSSVRFEPNTLYFHMLCFPF